MRISAHLKMIVATAGLVAMLSCSDDENNCPTCGGPAPPTFKDLSKREHVVSNMELAYNKRQIDEYDALLDENFVFLPTAADVVNGLPPNWGRVDEVTAVTGLFGNASSIDLDIKWEGGLAWVELIPSSAPTEKWYITTVNYAFAIKIGASTYPSYDKSKVQFTVRNAGTDKAPHWQLVEMRDLDQAPGPGLQQAFNPAHYTWGQVKAGFLP